MKFFWTDFLVCLPLALALGALWFLFEKTRPYFDELEASRTKTIYQETAQGIFDGEIKAREYALGTMKSAGRLSRGSWGFDPRGGEMLVWYREPKQTRVKGVKVPMVDRPLYLEYYRYGAVAFLFLLAFIVDLGLRQYRKFSKLRDDFIRASAHDLRTPVYALDLFTCHADENTRNLVRRLQVMVGNLSAFVKTGGKRPQPKIETVDFVRLIQEAYEIYRADFEEYHSVQFDFAALNGGELPILADAGLTMQILWNLIGNELKYAAKHGPIALCLRPEGKFAVLEVRDSGPGMSARERRHAFDRYFRAKSLDDSGCGGFGIGLCNAREFAHLMRGSLAVAANPPKGSIFTLKLPLANEGNR